MATLPLDVRYSLNKQVTKLLKKEFEKEAYKEFKKIKEELIIEFLNHPVTQEIKAGPSATNISGTLNGVSNLFAFIGFEESDDPISPILDLLNNIQMNYAGEINMGNKFNVTIPEPANIFSVTPMPWASGRSWAEGIETGISGLGYLLKSGLKSSRSGAAIQSSVKVRSGGFRNVQYISALINKYKKKFEKLK
jgi:hypothetical protein